ncbi:MAG: hypothetical protein MJ170_03275 [Alphaproteobacteria bacterium]|nr:hypothetical protein [Alphaproteobacteria bacterium]
MKRLFLILCLIIICNTSYADIASVGYVDSVVAPIQDSISNIDSIKQDKLPNPPNNNGIYKLVWNGNTGQIVWEFEQYSLTCTPNTYDIGFSQCIDPTIEGTDYTYNAGAMTWKTVFPYGNVSGVAVCNDTSGSYAVSSTTEQVETGGVMCWCKMTHPATSNWVFDAAYSSSSVCADGCAYACGRLVQNYSDFRSGVFSSVGQ